MGIKRVRSWQSPSSLDDWQTWSRKHLGDHSAESSLRIQDFDHNRLANLHQGVTTTDSPEFVGLTLSGLTASKPVFTSAAKALVSTGTLAVDQGGTGLATYAVGDILYASAATTLSLLADVAAGAYLRSGGVTTAPLWSTLILPNAATAFRLPVATSANAIGELAAVGATGEYLAGVTGAIPAWATLNQAAVAGLTTADGPTFAHLHLSDLDAITTIAEAWIGPSSTTGIYFKGGNVGIGTTAPTGKLDINGNLVLSKTPDVVSAAGAISVTTPITHIVTNGVGTVLTLAAGVEGQIKYVVLKTLTSALQTDVITPDGGGAGFTTITMDAVGDAVTLLYTNAKWTIIGSFACAIV